LAANSDPHFGSGFNCLRLAVIRGMGFSMTNDRMTIDE
jgi:hypothetical protein